MMFLQPPQTKQSEKATKTRVAIPHPKGAYQVVPKTTKAISLLRDHVNYLLRLKKTDPENKFFKRHAPKVKDLIKKVFGEE